MNLRTTIRKVLREEFNPKTYLLRRIPSDELSMDFEYALEYMSKGFRKIKSMRKNISYESFKDTILTMTIIGLEQQLISSGDFKKIKEIKNYLYSEYSEIIKSRYEELTGNKIDE